ncbi:uncharacterized protein EV422DRAFT_173028 [Fimicolochytrium jonesii]|uniref:uncharacterized protein n=1 Tax=Fimicolochytrium jonesii TaxID=1396493 RepID=UPI0022FE1A9E|nr:uncharacterized protein EV422DRAFT_173028 [Fimicolochytrium jonesii]KAI8818591.1 hypothetical protein EV422DRAFT_173028 [Fimicolochytrium jonesii]
MSNNQVRGPASALSSFLRERGIRAPAARGWARRTDIPATTADPAAPTTGGNNDTEPDSENSGSDPDNDSDSAPAVSRTRTTTRASLRTRTPSGDAQVGLQATMMEVEVEEEVVVDDEAEEGEECQTTTTSSRAKEGKEKAAKTPAKVAAKAKAGAKKRKKGKDDNDDDDENYPGPTSAGRSNHSKRRKPDMSSAFNAGSVGFCSRCKRRYLVGHDQASLCSACYSIQASKISTGGPKKPRKKKGVIIPEGADESAGSVLSLRNLCIRLIADCIDSVEGFGDISEATKLQISKIIGRHRQLKPENVRLFTGPTEQRVHLFECTYLDDEALSEVAAASPNVRHFHLGNCGRITDKTLKVIGDTCAQLETLCLDGPFLPSNAAFATLFEGLGEKLRELTLRHAAKLNKNGIETLVGSCPHLRVLRLEQCMKLDDESIQLLGNFKDLEVLEIGFMGDKVSEESFVNLLMTIGAGLKTLVLNGHSRLTDSVLTAIASNCTQLHDLSLEECESLTSEGVLQFVRDLKSSTGLTSLSLSRNVTMKDDLIVALVNLHGHSLQKLNLNGLDELTEYSLNSLATGCPNLRELDVSWVRNVDDFVLKQLVDSCPSLAKVKVYGCNRLTEIIVNGHTKNADGVEVRFVGNEYI